MNDFCVKHGTANNYCWDCARESCEDEIETLEKQVDKMKSLFKEITNCDYYGDGDEIDGYYVPMELIKTLGKEIDSWQLKSKDE